MYVLGSVVARHGADTERCYTTVTQAIVGRFGQTFSFALKAQMMGQRSEDAAALLVDALRLPITVAQFLRERDAVLEALFADCSLMPGAERLVRHLHAHRVPIAVATSSHAEHVVLKTARHTDLFALFDHVVTGDDAAVRHGKPHPDIFQACVARFSEPPADPSNVLVFEDSPNGLQAALAGGMQCVLVPDPLLDRAQATCATLVLDSLERFQPEHFGLPPFSDGAV